MESQNIEYKQLWKDDYLKWICGFANGMSINRHKNQIIALQANMTTLKKCGENVEKMLLVRRVGPDKGGHWEIIG